MVHYECHQPFLLCAVILNKRTCTGASLYNKCILKCFSLREIETDVSIKDHIVCSIPSIFFQHQAEIWLYIDFLLNLSAGYLLYVESCWKATMLMQILTGWQPFKVHYQLAQTISGPRLKYAMQSLVQSRLGNQGENIGFFSLPFLSPSGCNG